MNKNELKKVLKPLIKECIKEVLFEEKGTLSHIISEVAHGIGKTTKQIVKEQHEPQVKYTAGAARLKEHKKKLLDAIGKEAYGGITPTPSSTNAGPIGVLADLDPKDPGVDISSIFNPKSFAIFNKMTGKK